MRSCILPLLSVSSELAMSLSSSQSTFTGERRVILWFQCDLAASRPPPMDQTFQWSPPYQDPELPQCSPSPTPHSCRRCAVSSQRVSLSATKIKNCASKVRNHYTYKAQAASQLTCLLASSHILLKKSFVVLSIVYKSCCKFVNHGLLLG